MKTNAEIADAVLEQYELTVIRIELALYNDRPLTNPTGWLDRIRIANTLFALYARLAGSTYAQQAQCLGLPITRVRDWTIRASRLPQLKGIVSTRDIAGNQTCNAQSVTVADIERNAELIKRYKARIKTLSPKTFVA